MGAAWAVAVGFLLAVGLMGTLVLLLGAWLADRVVKWLRGK